jgi:hypothetical protein
MRDAVGRVEHPDSVEKVAVFVDGANLYHSIKSYYKGVLDYGVLLEAAVGDRKLLRATFYIVEKQEADENSGARSFVYNLNKFGYKVRSKPLVEVVSAGQCTSQALLDVCDLHTDLGDIPDLFRHGRPAGQQQVG